MLAAVDLGSNSFHMIVGELRHGQLTIIDRLKETVRLSEGLGDKGTLTDAARQRALDCLSRFGERLRDMHASSVRTAGTSALRRAANSGDFLMQAEKALGHPIEVIPGIEEARLIYVGVSHSMPPTDGLRLVLDIGGGSTELILGQADKPSALESLHMGCVLMTERYFPGGRISRENFAAARLAAKLELRPVKAFFRGIGEVEAIGTSGTIRATEDIARELGYSEAGLTPKVIDKLIDKALEFDSIAELSLPTLSERRAQVWPGGLSILAELMNVLHIETLKVSDGALREGLLYDLLGRLQHEDARERTVQAMVARYHVDADQAGRVAHLARELREQCRETWKLGSDLAGLSLDWAARLHEIGLDISHDGFHRHGAYIAEWADMPGFPRAEQRLMAFLIGSQRHAVDMTRLQALPRAWRDPALRLAILLRIAVLLNRSRKSDAPKFVGAQADGTSLNLRFDPLWLRSNPLTIADLERERELLKPIGYTLDYR